MGRVTTITKAAEVLGITRRTLYKESELEIATRLAKEYGGCCRGMGGSDYNIEFDRMYVYLDKHQDWEQKFTYLNFVKAVRVVLNEGNALQAAHNEGLATLADIEARIHFHVRTAYASIVEVGRCLIEAKNSGLIPHGEWEAWVREHAQMSENRAQRLMKIAREVPANSRMAELPISKIQEILALPEAQREPMAARAADESMTVRELREAVAREQAKSEQLMAKYNAEMKRRKKAEADTEDLSGKISRNQIDRQMELDAMEVHHRSEIRELEKQLAEAKAAPAGISAEAQARIDALEAKLAEAEDLAEHHAQLRQEAQDALMEAQSRNARGAAPMEEDLTAFEVMTAARTFISGVGYMPHSTKLATLDAKDRADLISYVDMVAKWAEDMRAALARDNVIVIEGA